MASTSITLASQVYGSPSVRSRPLITKLCLILADAMALLLSVGIGGASKAAFWGDVHLASYLVLWPFLFVFLLVYAACGLYSIVALSASDELRRGTLATAVSFLVLCAATVTLRGAGHRFTWTLVLALTLSLILMPLARATVRRRFARQKWWGYPAVIFGAGPTGQKIVRSLLDDPRMGLKPLAIIDERTSSGSFHGIPVFDCYESVRIRIPEGRHAYAVFAQQDLPAGEGVRLMDKYHADFSHMLVVPEMNGVSAEWGHSKNLGGMLGLEMAQQRA